MKVKSKLPDLYLFIFLAQQVGRMHAYLRDEANPKPRSLLGDES
jgi:hypothetical protein